MTHSTTSPVFVATDDWDDFTSHGLLVIAHDFASGLGLFKAFDRFLTVKMKKRDYSWQQKFATLWASIVVGCSHTCQINDRLGPDGRAAAAPFGLDRFPDPSSVTAA